MSFIKKNFDSYRLYYMSGYDQPAVLNCYDGDSYVGSISFYKAGATVPPNNKTSSGYVNLRYTISQFNDVIGILRYEKPLFLMLSIPSLIGYIATSEAEPVGEEES